MNWKVFLRHSVNAVAMVAATLSTIFGLFWLAWILWTTVSEGAAALKPTLFTQMTPPPGDDGRLHAGWQHLQRSTEHHA